MHLRSLSELQGFATQRGASAPRTTQDGASWSSRTRKDSSSRCSPPKGALLWAWLLLGALVVPGAWSSLSEEEEELLVELHNYYRGQVSPSASAMLPLKWDPALKVLAENYATKCVWNHNPELDDTGENLFAGTGALELRLAMEKWFLEHLDYTYENNSCDEDKMCGHYTQMVWADTHRVGCAVHVCSSMEGLDWEKINFLVCNYFPAGNYEEMKPYVEGDSCSRCPENFQKCENNLCVPDIPEEVGETGGEEETTIVSIQPTDDLNTSAAASLPPPKGTVPSAVGDSPVLSTTPESTPKIITTTIFSLDSEDIPPPTIAAKTTQPPPAPPTTAVKKAGHDPKVEEEKKEKTRTEAPIEEGRDVERVLKFELGRSPVQTSAGSASSPSVLLACLLILTLRL